MTRVLNDSVVEAAAKAMFAEEQCDRYQRKDVDGNWRDRLNESDQGEYRALARAALSAAADALAFPANDGAVVFVGPDALAQHNAAIWDEGWDARAEYTHRRDVPTNWPDLNPYRANDGAAS